MKRNEIYRIHGREYKTLTKELLRTCGLEELLPQDRAIRIGIKPNLVAPTPAFLGATTHPEVVAGLVEFLQELGYKNILIAEGSWVGDKTSDAYEYCGYRELVDRYEIEFLDAQKDSHHPVLCPGLGEGDLSEDLELEICDVVDSIDFLINVPVLKGHCQTKMTCALKNMKGLIPNTEKRHFHAMGLHKPIAYLTEAIAPDFILLDHICGDLDFEEGGHPVERDCIMAALDPVLLDSYACYLMGYEVDEVPYIRYAADLGAGLMDLGQAEIHYINENPYEERLPMERRILDVSYAVSDWDSCSACYGNLVPALYRLKDEGILADLKTKISIGQGHAGKGGELGVGKCTSGCKFFVQGCPPKEEDIYQKLKEYILSCKE